MTFLDAKYNAVSFQGHAKRLQPEIGRISKQEAKEELAETAWDAPLTGMRGIVSRIHQTKQFTIPNTNFPDNVAPPGHIYPTIPYPDENNLDLLPVIHQNAPDTTEMDEIFPIVIQFRHRKEDGTINRHEDNYIGVDNVFRLFLANPNIYDDGWGKCWKFTQADDPCTARLYPQEAAYILRQVQPLISPEKYTEYSQILMTYTNKFNEKFAPREGGRYRRTYKRKRGGANLVANPDAEDMFHEATDAVCALPPQQTAVSQKRRRTYKKRR